MKPIRVVGSTENQTETQRHTLRLVEMEFEDGTRHIYIEVEEHAGGYRGQRYLPLSETVHVLLNLEENEIFDIGNRARDWQGQHTPVTSPPSASTAETPIPLPLVCPSCSTCHLDVGEFATRAHRTHRCLFCHYEWRPFDAPTCGTDLDPAHAKSCSCAAHRELREHQQRSG